MVGDFAQHDQRRQDQAPGAAAGHPAVPAAVILWHDAARAAPRLVPLAALEGTKVESSLSLILVIEAAACASEDEPGAVFSLNKAAQASTDPFWSTCSGCSGRVPPTSCTICSIHIYTEASQQPLASSAQLNSAHGRSGRHISRTMGGLCWQTANVSKIGHAVTGSSNFAPAHRGIGGRLRVGAVAHVVVAPQHAGRLPVILLALNVKIASASGFQC